MKNLKLLRNLTLRQLRVFLAAARHLSFAKAAEELNLTAPAVSMQIKEMEEVLGGVLLAARLFDALSLIFPPGEKFFMTCVRDYRDQITDAKLLDEIKGFNRQEAQHSMVHNQYNDRLRSQGIDVDRLMGWLEDLLFNQYRSKRSRAYTLAITCALEHFTSIGAHSLFDKRDVLKDADHRVRAMYAWHAMEEIEHKAVAFDVMQKVAKELLGLAGALPSLRARVAAAAQPALGPQQMAALREMVARLSGFSAKLRLGGPSAVFLSFSGAWAATRQSATAAVKMAMSAGISPLHVSTLPQVLQARCRWMRMARACPISCALKR